MKSKFLSQAVNKLSLGHIKYGWYSSEFTSKASPIVIGGSPRSGTSLLYAFLNAHSRLFIGWETGLFSGNRDLQHLSRRKDLSIAELKSLYKASRCLPDFTERVLTTVMARNGKVRWGDKSPINVTLIGQIFKYFPNARFIHIIRDGRDAACSLYDYNRRGFIQIPQSADPWSGCIQMWDSWVRKGLAFRSDPRYYELKYELLAENPSAVLPALFKWLNEPGEPDIIEKKGLSKVFNHPNVRKPAGGFSVGRWRRDLPREAREFFRGSANELLITLGYAKDDGWIIE